MKVIEFKSKLINGINKFIDTYFGSQSIQDKFINTTIKILIIQNQNKYDDILNLFADENGEIDENLILEKYSDILNDGFIFDIRNYVKSDILKSILPNKALKITKGDIVNMMG